MQHIDSELWTNALSQRQITIHGGVTVRMNAFECRMSASSDNLISAGAEIAVTVALKRLIPEIKQLPSFVVGSA